jgi:hypothetical protein
MNRRSFLATASSIICFPLAGCGSSGVDASGPDAIRSSIRSLARSLQSEDRGEAKASAFLRAAWRLAHPVRFTGLPFDFDVTGELPVAVLRADEPALGNEAWWSTLGVNGSALGGMSPDMIVSVYANQDQRVINAQERWIANWKITERQSRQSSSFDGERRRGLLASVAPRRASYEWVQSASGRRPFLRLAIFNGLDENMTGAILSVDLMDDRGRAVGSHRFRHEPPFAVAPRVEAIWTIDLGLDSPLGARTLQDVAQRLRVAVRVDNVVLANNVMLVPPISTDSQIAQRRSAMVASLETRLRSARDNLIVFRTLFGTQG